MAKPGYFRNQTISETRHLRKIFQIAMFAAAFLPPVAAIAILGCSYGFMFALNPEIHKGLVDVWSDKKCNLGRKLHDHHNYN